MRKQKALIRKNYLQGFRQHSSSATECIVHNSATRGHTKFIKHSCFSS